MSWSKTSKFWKSVFLLLLEQNFQILEEKIVSNELGFDFKNLSKKIVSNELGLDLKNLGAQVVLNQMARIRMTERCKWKKMSPFKQMEPEIACN